MLINVSFFLSFMIIDKIFGFLWYIVKIDFFQNFENYYFAKVYVCEMQKSVCKYVDDVSVKIFSYTYFFNLS